MNRRDFLKTLIVATAALPLVSQLAPKARVPDFSDWDYIDLPRETGNIMALVPHHDSILAFTERAVYRIDYVHPYISRFDRTRLSFRRLDGFDMARVTKQRYL